MSSLDVPVYKLAHLPQKVKMSRPDVPVYKLAQLSQKIKNVKSRCASL